MLGLGVVGLARAAVRRKEIVRRSILVCGGR
jgi:hypothetical protein